LGVGRKASDITLAKLIATKDKNNGKDWNDLSEKGKIHKGL
jgi:hypothetical protein